MGWLVIVRAFNGMEVDRTRHLFKFTADLHANRLRRMALDLVAPFQRRSERMLFEVSVERNEWWQKIV